MQSGSEDPCRRRYAHIYQRHDYSHNTEKTSCRATARFLYYHLIYTDFIPNHFSATMGKEKNGHPSDTRNIMSLNAYRQTIFLP